MTDQQQDKAREKPQQRIDFERWYSMNAFDYHRDPIGSRDCSLQWVAWQAAQESLRAELTEKNKDYLESVGKCVGLEMVVAEQTKQIQQLEAEVETR